MDSIEYGPFENKFEWERKSNMKNIFFVIKPKIFKNIIMIFLFEYQYNYPAPNKKGYAPGI